MKGDAMSATILIVDDSATMRALVRAALEVDAHAVVEAPNGAAALSATVVLGFPSALGAAAARLIL